MKIKFWPNARAGQTAAVLTLLFVLLMSMKFGLFGGWLRIPLPSPFIAALGVAGFVFGLISIIKNKDRAVFTWLSIPIGLLVIVWVGAEILFPH